MVVNVSLFLLLLILLYDKLALRSALFVAATYVKAAYFASSPWSTQVKQVLTFLRRSRRVTIDHCYYSEMSLLSRNGQHGIDIRTCDCILLSQRCWHNVCLSWSHPCNNYVKPNWQVANLRRTAEVELMSSPSYDHRHKRHLSPYSNDLVHLVALFETVSNAGQPPTCKEICTTPTTTVRGICWSLHSTSE